MDDLDLVCPWCRQPYIAVAQTGRRRSFTCLADGTVTVWD